MKFELKPILTIWIFPILLTQRVISEFNKRRKQPLCLIHTKWFIPIASLSCASSHFENALSWLNSTRSHYLLLIPQQDKRVRHAILRDFSRVVTCLKILRSMEHSRTSLSSGCSPTWGKVDFSDSDHCEVWQMLTAIEEVIIHLTIGEKPELP